jgi:CRP/FNR family cyclic AMP-dependent transcriptional regulator
MSVAADIDFVDFAATIGTIANYAPGDLIFRAGDAANFMYVVLRGSVEIVVKDEVLEKVGAGNALGILSLVDGKNRSADARACEITRLSLIDQKKFRYMVEEMPHFCWYVMDELAHRLRATNAAL